MREKVNIRNTAFILAVILLFAACSAWLFGAPNEDVFAYAAAEYGGTDAGALWYYAEDFLNIKGVNDLLKEWYKGVSHAELEKIARDPVKIAVIDTGVDWTHEIFDGVVVKTADGGNVVGYNARTGKTSESGATVRDTATDKHGTAVASIAAMLIKELGLQDYIKIYPIKANRADVGDNSESFDAETTARAIKWAHEELGADIINLSLGVPKISNKGHIIPIFVDNSKWIYNENLQNALRAASRECVIMAAAGNEGNNDSASNAFYPAAFDYTIGVMAYDPDGEKRSSSNFGNSYDLIAPGGDIYCAKGGTVNKYEKRDGTSMAAPIASAAAAVLEFMLRAQPVEEGSGEQAPQNLSATVFNILKDHDGGTIEYVNGLTKYKLTKLDIVKLLGTKYTSDDTVQYVTPDGIEVVFDDKGFLKDGVVDMSVKDMTEFVFTANLTSKQGGVIAPAESAEIEWWLEKDGADKKIGSGSTLAFIPDSVGGEFVITARYDDGSERGLVSEVEFNVRHERFVQGDVRVTLPGNEDKTVDEAESDGVLYPGKSMEFALTGMKYVDPAPIVWYVNGEEMGRGARFSFTPSEKGVYEITISYDGEKLSAMNAFTLTVVSFADYPLENASGLTPLTLGLTVSAAAAVVGGAIAAAVICTRRKKKKKNLSV